MTMVPEYNNSFSDNSTTNLMCGVTCIQGIATIFLIPYMAVCLPSNLWVMWLITHGTKDSLAAELFHLNMAICETIYTLDIPLYFYCLLDPVGCDVILIMITEFSVFIWFGRPLFQCCICVERYLAVVHPLTFIRFKPLRFRVVCSGLMWVAITFMLLSIWKVHKGSTVIIAISYFMTLSVIVFCCLSVLWSLKQPGPVETERTGGNNMKRRAFNIIALNLGIFLVTYLPTFVILSLADILSKDMYSYLYNPAMCLTVFSGIAQPLLHLHKAGKLPGTCFFTAVKP